jgi:hypothetical protein
MHSFSPDWCRRLFSKNPMCIRSIKMFHRAAVDAGIPRHLQDCRCITFRQIRIPFIDFVTYNTMCIIYQKSQSHHLKARRCLRMGFIGDTFVSKFINHHCSHQHVLLPLLGSQRNHPSRSMTCTTCNRVLQPSDDLIYLFYITRLDYLGWRYFLIK